MKGVGGMKVVFIGGNVGDSIGFRGWDFVKKIKILIV